MDKIFDVLTEQFHSRLSQFTGNDKKSINDDENSQPTVKIEVKLSRETLIHEQKITNEKSNRARSNSVNNHNSNTTVVDNENR